MQIKIYIRPDCAALLENVIIVKDNTGKSKWGKLKTSNLQVALTSHFYTWGLMTSASRARSGPWTSPWLTQQNHKSKFKHDLVVYFSSVSSHSSNTCRLDVWMCLSGDLPSLLMHAEIGFSVNYCLTVMDTQELWHLRTHVTLLHVYNTLGLKPLGTVHQNKENKGNRDTLNSY